MPPTIVIPTQQQWAQIEADRQKNSPLAIYQSYLTGNSGNAPVSTPGSPNAVTKAAGENTNLANLSNPDWIKAMSEMITQINIDAQNKANAARIPGATGLENQSSTNIASALRGEVPNDVYREMAQRSAERGVSTGSPMGANTTADLMRALGLTSLDLQNTGQTWLNNALARNPGATPANTQALVTTPAQAEALALQRQNMELDYLARMAAINEAENRRRTGYGGGGGGGSSGSFRPATNWQTGAPTQTVTPTPTSGWNLPYSLGNGLDTVLPGMDYYDPANDVVQPGMNYSPADYSGGGWGAYDLNPVSYNPDLYPDYSGINTGGMSEDELDWLYNVGG